MHFNIKAEPARHLHIDNWKGYTIWGSNGEGKRRNGIWNGTWNGMWNGMGMQISRHFFQDSLKLREIFFETSSVRC